MGCSATKNVTVEPINGNAVNNRNNPVQEEKEHHQPLETRKVPSLPSLEGEEPETENLTMNNVQKTSNGLSFDISFEENENESIIKKHPPKRLQKFEEPHPNAVSLDQLQEKLEEAEERRKQVLMQRMESARNSFRRQSNAFSIEDDGIQKLTVVEESQGSKEENSAA